MTISGGIVPAMKARRLPSTILPKKAFILALLLMMLLLLLPLPLHSPSNMFARISKGQH